jgi:hypothetical protein
MTTSDACPKGSKARLFPGSGLVAWLKSAPDYRSDNKRHLSIGRLLAKARQFHPDLWGPAPQVHPLP